MSAETKEPPKAMNAEAVDDCDELFYPTEHKAELTLLGVSDNECGQIMYTLYLQDTLNLDKPLAFEITVSPDGTVDPHTAFEPQALWELFREDPPPGSNSKDEET